MHNLFFNQCREELRKKCSRPIKQESKDSDGYKSFNRTLNHINNKLKLLDGITQTQEPKEPV